MQYIIDGYNFLFRFRGKFLSLEKNRNQIIELLEKELSTIKGPCSIVFDSAEQIKDYAQKSSYGDLEIIYAPKDRTADEYIIELLENSRSPKTISIVTSDAGLARQCQYIGALILSIEEFVAFMMMKNGAPKVEGKPHFEESKGEIARLLKIFEEKLGSD